MSRRGRSRRRRRAQRMYRVLVRLYPAKHRRAFGEDMVQTFGDHYRDVVEGRGGSRLRFWPAVLADVATSVFAEHAAEVKARRPRPPRTHERRRPVRVGRRLHYLPARVVLRGPHYLPARVVLRGPHHLPARVVLRAPHHQVIYRGRVAALVAAAVLIGLALGAGTATGHVGIGLLLAVLLAAGWLAYGLRLIRPAPAGPRRGRPGPSGGASVREPRRPLPISPTGSIARPRSDQEEPGQNVALI